MPSPHHSTTPDASVPLLAIFRIFLRLGLTCFGGPIAHLGYFRAEFVERRRWLSDQAYGDLVGLCQFLPGPASSQVGIALGFFKGGLPGALASWAGFTLPSAIALVLFGLLLGALGGVDANWLHGLKIVTVAIVAQAIWAMGKSLCPDRRRATLAVAATLAQAWFPGAMTQIGIIMAGGALGWRWLRPVAQLPHSPLPLRLSKTAGVATLLLFAALLGLLPALASQNGSQGLRLFDAFFRAGALVFGGGHVVLPILQAEVVPTGWVSTNEFLAGYGAAQAVPGPLFTFAAYLGAVSHLPPSGWQGAGIALAAIFLPAFLLVIGSLPLWESVRRHPAMQRAMLGVNAAVVGLLLAAFHDPVWTSAIHSGGDFALALVAFLLLAFWKLPPWLVVLLCSLATGLGWH